MNENEQQNQRYNYQSKPAQNSIQLYKVIKACGINEQCRIITPTRWFRCARAHTVHTHTVQSIP